MGIIHKPPKIHGKEDIDVIFSILYGERNTEEITQFIKQYFNEKYYHWDKFRRIPIPAGYTHDELWKAIRLSRTGGVQITIGQYKFSFQIPNFITRKLHHIDLHMGGSLTVGDLIPKGDEMKYLYSSLIEESIASSQIEGAATTREVAKDMIISERLPRTHDEKMILNNYYAMQFISRNKKNYIDKDTILNLHQILTKGTLENTNDEGRFRMSDDIHVVDTLTNETLHSPPKSSEVPKLMEEFVLFFNTESEKQFIHPIVKGIIIHFLIGWIHPFADGNGRTARGLFYWYIIKSGYWLTEYVSISRIIKRSTVEYKNSYLYTETDDNDLTYFIDYNIGCLIDGLVSFKEYIHSQGEKQKIMGDQLIGTGLNLRQIKILRWLEENKKTVTVQQTSNTFLEPLQTTRLDLEGLVKIGKLQKLPLDKKSFGYTFNKNI